MNKKINSFEDLNVWKEGLSLAISVYNELKSCKEFGLRDQIQRAAVSIPSNIAEGFERESNKDFIRFLYYSKSSARELRTQLFLCKELELISEEIGNKLIEHSRKVSGMTYNLIKTRYNRFS